MYAYFFFGRATSYFVEKDILVLPKGSLKHISSKRSVDNIFDMFGGRVLQQTCSSSRRHVPLFIRDFRLHTFCSPEKNRKEAIPIL